MSALEGPCRPCPCLFDRTDPSLAGRFWQNYIGHPAGGWAWATITSLPGIHAGLTGERQDDEDVLDLSGVANNPLALGVIDGLLTGGASRRGAVRTSYVTWANVHSGVRASDPTRHQPWELLGTLHIDFHVSTPWYCSDVDGTITYYIFFFLDSGGTLRANVDGWSFHYDGGGPFCTSEVSSRLRSAVSAGMPTVQSQIDLGVSLFSGGGDSRCSIFCPAMATAVGFPRTTPTTTLPWLSCLARSARHKEQLMDTNNPSTGPELPSPRHDDELIGRESVDIQGGKLREVAPHIAAAGEGSSSSPKNSGPPSR